MNEKKVFLRKDQKVFLQNLVVWMKHKQTHHHIFANVERVNKKEVKWNKTKTRQVYSRFLEITATFNPSWNNLFNGFTLTLVYTNAERTTWNDIKKDITLRYGLQSDLIQHWTRNGHRHASGPIYANLPSVTYILWKNVYNIGRFFLLSFCVQWKNEKNCFVLGIAISC